MILSLKLSFTTCNDWAQAIVNKNDSASVLFENNTFSSKSEAQKLHNLLGISD